MSDILIRNARLVSDGREWEADLRVGNGRIRRIDASLPGRPGDIDIDAAGQWLLPGMIDDQVHFREPGAPHKGSIASESRAAVAGGVTSFMDMPNTRPATTCLDALADKESRAAAGSVANYGFHLGATRHNLDLIAALPPAPPVSKCSWAPAPATCCWTTRPRWNGCSPLARCPSSPTANTRRASANAKPPGGCASATTSRRTSTR